MKKSTSTQSLNQLNQSVMDTESIKEYIRWVEKLISAQHLYYESRHIDEFTKWMEAEEIVHYLSQYLKEEIENQRNKDIYLFSPN